MRQLITYKLVCFLFVTLLVFLVCLGQFPLRFFENLRAMDKCPLQKNEKLRFENHIDNSLDLWSRTDVQTCTYWRAPILWEGMFDPIVYDKYHKEQGTSVAVTVFAVGKYLETYLKDFISSAELHFMVGLPVTYYIFTDVPASVPMFQLKPGRAMEIMKVQRYKRWQDVSMFRMKHIADAIESHIHRRNQYVFCFDVDQVFVGRFGSEALGDSVALLHASFFRSPVAEYTYDRNPRSVAYMENGDFYYHAAIFGGTWQNIKNITETCYRHILEDKEHQVEALWHDESHLNKYFWLHKPSKVLSPEYCWPYKFWYNSDIRVPRLLWSKKYYETLRT